MTLLKNYSLNSTSTINNHLNLLKRLLTLVNLLSNHTPTWSVANLLNMSIVRKKKTPLYCNLINNNFYQNKTFNSWVTIINSNLTDKLIFSYTNTKNTIQVQPNLVTSKTQTLLLNNISNNSNWKNDRWLYKFSLLNTKVTNMFYNLSEQKSLINKVILNDQSFNLNLWIKNIKTSQLDVTTLFNLNPLFYNDTTFTQSGINTLYQSSFNSSLYNLTFFENSIAFLYKRFFIFNSINSNIYKKNLIYSVYKTSTNLDYNFDNIDGYIFQSTKNNINILNLNSFKELKYFTNFNIDITYLYYLLVLETSFTYNSTLTNTIISNTRSYYKINQTYNNVKLLGNITRDFTSNKKNFNITQNFEI